jgi:deoxycytidylate deaminase
MAHKSDLELMQYAADIAQRSDMRTKHGCVIIDNKGTIISTAYNKTLNISPHKLKEYDRSNKISRHAEENALRHVDRRKLSGARLYVVRSENTSINNCFMNSKPCKRCSDIIESCMRRFGLKAVYYSSGSGIELNRLCI